MFPSFGSEQRWAHSTYERHLLLRLVLKLLLAISAFYGHCSGDLRINQSVKLVNVYTLS